MLCPQLLGAAFGYFLKTAIHDIIMITDTAPFRDPHYHTVEDTVDKIDFEKLSRVTDGISQVIRDFVGLAGYM
jgi:hypothetical protein